MWSKRNRALLVLALVASCSPNYNGLRGHKSDAGPSGAAGSTGSAGNVGSGLGGAGGGAGSAGGAGVSAGGTSGTAGAQGLAGAGGSGASGSSGGAAGTPVDGGGDVADGGGCSGPVQICGDGVVVGSEQCDDGNTADGDGCSSICRFESKPSSIPEGWFCDTPRNAKGCLGPTKCVTTTCGNKIQEGTEQCDDGNAATGDGCSPFCRLEPICPINGGACTTPCGDGILLDVDKASGQECDDGNLVNGDGCSSNCKVEAGFTCSDVSASAGHVLMPPIVIRDFKGWNEIGGHPDFEHYIGAGAPGTVQSMLSATGVPTHVPECMPQTSNGCAPLAGANPVWDPTVDWFGMWYVDNATYSKTVVQTLSLLGQLGGVNSTTCGTVGNPGCTSYQFSTGAFFPIDDQGWGNGPNTHNYGFTSLVRHWFVYAGAATFSFKGDDDVWIFINKTLAVDLGGTHGSATGVITLDPSDGSGYVCDFVAPGPPSPTSVCDSAARTGGGHVVNLGLQRGALYEVAVFHAERHTSASAYALTLAAAGTSRSSCSRK